ncbi:MAG: phosphohydrolase, partial [Methylococcaceae bacterium]|nr:phosphohydrolase [Methylococcaceae bacterium]
MNTTALATLSICTYLASALLIVRYAYQNSIQRTPIYLAWVAVCAHILYTVIAFQQNNGFNFGFISTASLISLI